jgi:two-component system chemotaxis response regulator CheY
MSEKIKVLIVDDAAFMRRKLRTILEKSDMEVVGEAETGRGAIEMLKACDPDVITMDITMPEADGITSLKAIRQARPGARVVMISAIGQKEKVKDSILAGARDFIIKPFVPERVAEVVSRVARMQ